MRELDTSLQADAHQAGLLGRRERLGVDQLHGWTRERRHPQERGSRLRRQGRQPPHDQLLQVGRDGERGAVVVLVVLRQQLSDLERVERVPARDLRDSHQGRPRKALAGAVGDHAVKRRNRERPELEPPDRAAELCRAEPLALRLRPERHDHPHRAAGEPPGGEGEGRSRGRVQPVRVVDREHDPPVVGQRAEQRQQRRPDQAPLGRPLARGLQHRDLERVPLRRRQVFEETRVELGQQVGQPGEREGRLRLGRAGREDERVELARQPDGGFPDSGLADSRLPDDRERGLAFVGPKELRDLGELGLATDERGHGQRVVDAD